MSTLFKKMGAISCWDEIEPLMPLREMKTLKLLCWWHQFSFIRQTMSSSKRLFSGII
jgi:hypothetical protein